MARTDEWLSLHEEEVIEPELPICDPHHHLWHEHGGRFVEPNYLFEQIHRDVSSGHNIVSTVFIECGAMFKATGPDHLKCVGETEFVNGIAAMSASGRYGNCRIAAGIVGTAPFLLGGKLTAEALDAQVAAGGGRFRGIRVGATWDASPAVPNARINPPQGMYSTSNFREAFKELEPRGLSFEGWCYHPQIPELTALADAFPNVTIILDHFGGPLGIGPYAGREDEVFNDWRNSVTELAKRPNVMAKLGGLVMEVNGFGWEHNDKPPTSQALMERTRRYYETTINLFGVERCMFESNFPVDMIAGTYRTLWNSFKRLAANYSGSEKAALFHDTATRVYRL
ncbi:MAG: amidohydrolase family protein [Rhodospirillales bacterium]|jgi:L-fuconolactonase